VVESKPLSTKLEKTTGIRLGIATAFAFILTACFHFYGINEWPWDHDEVPSLVELGLSNIEMKGAIADQAKKLPKLLPAWYGSQRFALSCLPVNEGGSRILPASCGVLAVVLAFYFAARYWGLAIGIALLLVLDGSQCFIWLSQQNRFYSMAVLFLTLTWIVTWRLKASLLSAACIVPLTGLAILSHNLLVVVFLIAFIAACLATWLGWAPRAVLCQCGLSAAVSVALYIFYLRPIMAGWVSGGTGGTNPLVSLIAQVGMPTLALALLGSAATLWSRATRKTWGWWVILLAGGLAFVVLSPWIMKAWNPRYGILFMPPVFVLAAFAVAHIGRLLKPFSLQVAWYCCVALLLLPKLASHYQDGSRHDFRTAASVVLGHYTEGNKVLSNWPETLQYYLPVVKTGISVDWWAESALPDSEFLIVFSSNAWEPLIQPPGRQVRVLAEIRKRRFDEQSHIVRVYQVAPK